jgi:hypothetical protein
MRKLEQIIETKLRVIGGGSDEFKAFSTELGH